MVLTNKSTLLSTCPIAQVSERKDDVKEGECLRGITICSMISSTKPIDYSTSIYGSLDSYPTC
ncbi:uncharacterized protein BO96DRAFT_345935 [Aspergillus niger CBS 101883]|uniref:Uncharacterized protein n=2 Tax=Aspergillus niger TaxID=5061 RepID=A2QHI8_ASPNC|nr:uncharacterized protein BO96DRAFT_345935 [Aspergillus niger CBS 101883]XP_059600406.1 hypothetical protein An04g00030 [Aspergillus niger]PYH53180.1 hypothetical protein BO96DRAFT_345935 [Aspergillus niger CBS 101883]CAK38458.1 hypothetical protein An04g00030 [Aspergillus niger]